MQRVKHLRNRLKNIIFLFIMLNAHILYVSFALSLVASAVVLRKTFALRLRALLR